MFSSELQNSVGAPLLCDLMLTEQSSKNQLVQQIDLKGKIYIYHKDLKFIDIPTPR